MVRTPRAARPAEVTMPAYEPLEQPLTTSAQSALRTLHDTHSLRKLKAHLLSANGAVTEMAGEINDRLMLKQNTQQKRHARLEREGIILAERDKDEQDVQCEELKEEVENLTAEMEGSTRKLIDVEARTVSIEDALRELASNAVAHGGALPWPSMTRAQVSQGGHRRRRRGLVVNNDDDEDDDSDQEAEIQDGEDQGQATSTQDAGLVRSFQKDMQTRQQWHDARPKRQKYATNNNYIGFKKIVHDALHPGDDAPPVPHADTWFPPSPRAAAARHGSSSSTNNAAAAAANGRTANNSTNSNNNGNDASTNDAHRRTAPNYPTTTTTNNNNNNEGDDGEDNDDDDEIAIAREKTSLKCPLTLLPFRDPVTSGKCPHSFEREAIFGMIAQSGARVGGRRRGEGVQAVKCPVCEQMLTKADLRPDQLLIRRIRRLAKAALPNDDDDDDYIIGDANANKHHHNNDDKNEVDIKKRASTIPLSSIPMSSTSSSAIKSTRRGSAAGGGEGEGGSFTVQLKPEEDDDDDDDDDDDGEEAQGPGQGRARDGQERRRRRTGVLDDDDIYD